MSDRAGMLGEMRSKGGVSMHRGRWRAYVYRGRKRISLGVYDMEAEARAVSDAARSRLGDAPPAGKQTLGAWGTKWLDARELGGVVRGWRQERSVWRAHVADAPIAAVAIDAITRPMLARWVKRIVDNGKSRQTAKHALRVVRGALKTAADEGQINENPARLVQVPKVLEKDAAPKWTFLTLEEITKLLTAPEVPQWARDVWAVAIYTGLRKSELAGLRWSDVDFGAQRLRVVRSYRATTKNGKSREVSLLPPALEALRRVQARTPGIGNRPVWTSASGGVRAPHWDPGGWRRYAMGMTRPDSGGVLDEERHVRFHDLRHTCASHLLMGSWLARPMSLPEVRDWLGHSSTKVTERYAHLAPGGIHDLAATFVATVQPHSHTPKPGK